jgi:hypothetical protein
MKQTSERNLMEKPADRMESNRRGKPAGEEINGPIFG